MKEHEDTSVTVVEKYTDWWRKYIYFDETQP